MQIPRKKKTNTHLLTFTSAPATILKIESEPRKGVLFMWPFIRSLQAYRTPFTAEEELIDAMMIGKL